MLPPLYLLAASLALNVFALYASARRLGRTADDLDTLARLAVGHSRRIDALERRGRARAPRSAPQVRSGSPAERDDD